MKCRISTTRKYLIPLFVLVLFTSIFVYIVYAKSSSSSPTPPPTSTKFNAILINTWAFINATKDGWETLLNNGTALDAIVAAGSRCERDQCDHTVGWGGSPDENGETTLDAMIMDGPTHNVGSVGALRNVKNVIAVARAVMEHTEHTMLVGDQATEFALALGFEKQNLTSNYSSEVYHKWKQSQCQPNYWKSVIPDPRKNCGPYKPITNKKNYEEYMRHLSAGSLTQSRSSASYHVDRYHHDTIGVVAIDQMGHIGSGTSTNGMTHKIPGRVGDSPIAGAGSYCDQEVGGAAATGDGDIIMRFLVSYQAVENLRQGMVPKMAAENALRRVLRKFPLAQVGLIVANNSGQYGAACINIDGGFPFSIGTTVKNLDQQRPVEEYTIINGGNGKSVTAVQRVQCVTL